MNGKISLLSAVLVVQILLIAALWMHDAQTTANDAPLLDLAVAQVDEIEILDDQSKRVLLSKSDTGWQVAGHAADAQQVEDLLAKLSALTAPWPVATSANSAERFAVAADNFQRQVRLSAENELLANLYFGTSPGFQRVHARRADQDSVYSVALSNYELNTNLDAWLDKSILATPDTPAKISVVFAQDASRNTTLDKTTEGWLFNGAIADQSAAQTYANRFATLQVLGLNQSDEERVPLASIELGLAQQTQRLSIERLGTEGDYLIGHMEDPQRYRLATYIAEQLLLTDADFSVQQAETAPLDN